jgi:hypothetical protein
VEFSGSRQLALMACNGDDALANDPRAVGEAALLMEHFKPADFSHRGGDQRRAPASADHISPGNERNIPSAFRLWPRYKSA